MRSLAEGDLGAAEHWLRRARAVHATPAVQVLARLVASPRVRREGNSLSAPGGGEGRGEVGDAPLHIGAVTPWRADEDGSLL